MEYTFFYMSIIITWIVFLVIIKLRPPRLSHLIIGIASVGYSAIYDMVLGGHYKLYHYISTDVSLLYTAIASLLVYPPLYILYVLLLPTRKLWKLVYTIGWTIALLIYEFITLYFKTVVLTGWRVFPWSVVTYIATFGLMLIFNHLLKNTRDCYSQSPDCQ